MKACWLFLWLGFTTSFCAIASSPYATPQGDLVLYHWGSPEQLGPMIANGSITPDVFSSYCNQKTGAFGCGMFACVTPYSGSQYAEHNPHTQKTYHGLLAIFIVPPHAAELYMPSTGGYIIRDPNKVRVYPFCGWPFEKKPEKHTLSEYAYQCLISAFEQRNNLYQALNSTRIEDPSTIGKIHEFIPAHLDLDYAQQYLDPDLFAVWQKLVTKEFDCTPVIASVFLFFPEATDGEALSLAAQFIQLCCDEEQEHTDLIKQSLHAYCKFIMEHEVLQREALASTALQSQKTLFDQFHAKTGKLNHCTTVLENL